MVARFWLTWIVVLTACVPKTSNVPKYDVAKEIAAFTNETVRKELLYGKELIDNTAFYIGPNGSKYKVTGNWMSCKNCHLDSGTREAGLSLRDSHGLYPQYRSRENRILTLSERINSCIKMPMLGTELPENSKEMQAMLMYIRFIGSGRSIKSLDSDDRLAQVTFPKTAASPEKGQKLYVQHCERCHGKNGEGVKNPEATAYVYPPLWGKEGYRSGSSMHRVSIFARFIKSNMPFDQATLEKPVLSDEDSFHIAAFVNSESINPRPKFEGQLFAAKEFKPFDYGEAPYADPFPPDQHKYGPFEPILQFYKEKRVHTQPTDGDLNAP